MEPLVEPPSESRAALLVVRAWPDDASPDGFRARLTQVPDTTEPVETTAVVDTIEALQAAVRQLVDPLVVLKRRPAPKR